MHRRAFLGALSAATSALLLPSWAGAAPATKIRGVERTKLGVTFKLALDHAPFPFAGSPYKDPTTVVFVPSHYRLPANREVDVVLHFHGHNGTAERAITGNALREQLFESKQNAILVVPQGPWMAADSSGGKLDQKGGMARLLTEVRRTMRGAAASGALGKAALAGAARVGRLCISAHSGGYKVAASCLRHGGVNVDEVYLFDALYGSVDDFFAWVVARKDERGGERHKLISHFAGGATRENNLDLSRRLEAAGVRCLHETKPGQLTRAELTKGRAIFMASTLVHEAAAYGQNDLRDCLFASCLTRTLDSTWFEQKREPRTIDARWTPP